MSHSIRRRVSERRSLRAKATTATIEHQRSLLSRRRFIRTTAAAASAVVAGTYVTPTLRSIGMPTAYAAVSAPYEPPPPPPPPYEPPPPVFDTGTPGYWANSGNINAGGKNLWDMLTDADWATAGGIGTNPYVHSTPFNSFFSPYAPFGQATMYEVANQGGGSDAAAKAARSLIAAFLNASFYGSVPDGYPEGFPLSVTQLQQLWADAVKSGKRSAFLGLNCTLDNANNGRALDAPCK